MSRPLPGPQAARPTGAVKEPPCYSVLTCRDSREAVRLCLDITANDGTVRLEPSAEKGFAAPPEMVRRLTIPSLSAQTEEVAEPSGSESRRCSDVLRSPAQAGMLLCLGSAFAP